MELFSSGSLKAQGGKIIKIWLVLLVFTVFHLWGCTKVVAHGDLRWLHPSWGCGQESELKERKQKKTN